MPINWTVKTKLTDSQKDTTEINSKRKIKFQSKYKNSLNKSF